MLRCAIRTTKSLRRGANGSKSKCCSLNFRKFTSISRNFRHKVVRAGRTPSVFARSKLGVSMSVASILLQRRRFAAPRNPAFDLHEYPKLPDKLPTKAQYGVLENLVGTWVNDVTNKGAEVYGLHTTIMPAPGSSSEQIFGTYHFMTDEYTEELTFEEGPGPVRNRLGSNEQFNGAVKYQSQIVDRSSNVIHFENGMYLWLGVWRPGHCEAKPYHDPAMLFSRETTSEDVKEDSLFPVLAKGSRGPQFIPPHSISRQGSIPHGNSIQLFGNQPIRTAKDLLPRDKDKKLEGTPGPIKGAPELPTLWADNAALSFDDSMGYKAKDLRDITNVQRIKPAFASFPISHAFDPSDPEYKSCYPQEPNSTVLDPNSGEAYMQRVFNGSQVVDGETMELFPFCVQPSLKLTDANEGLNIVSHNQFTLSTHQTSGHQGGILNNVGVDRYAKVVDMEMTMWISEVDDGHGNTLRQLQYEQRIHFEFQLGAGGGVTRWPHIQVNTLRRKDDVKGRWKDIKKIVP